MGRKEIWTHFWAGACCQDNNIHSPVYYTTVQTDQQQIYCRWRRRPENVSNSMRCRPLNHKKTIKGNCKTVFCKQFLFIHFIDSKTWRRLARNFTLAPLFITVSFGGKLFIHQKSISFLEWKVHGEITLSPFQTGFNINLFTKTVNLTFKWMITP